MIILFLQKAVIENRNNNGYRTLDKKYQDDIYNIFKRVLKTINHNKIKIIHFKENTPLKQD